MDDIFKMGDEEDEMPETYVYKPDTEEKEDLDLIISTQMGKDISL